MWHLRTKLGTFWVVEKPVSDTDTHKYYLGVDDEELGTYDDMDHAVDDVHKQSTGYFKWDCQSRVKVPGDISNWTEGEPDNWTN